MSVSCCTVADKTDTMEANLAATFDAGSSFNTKLRDTLQVRLIMMMMMMMTMMMTMTMTMMMVRDCWPPTTRGRARSTLCGETMTP